MYGAFLGDMIGAPYEFSRGNKTKEFRLFGERTKFTDDTVMTLAVAEALCETLGSDDEIIKTAVVKSMRKWGRKYSNVGYGRRFYLWLAEEDTQPYGSFGNGSAMRVSSAGWLASDLQETLHLAQLTAKVTHNHPEGIKGACAVAGAIFLASSGENKEQIKNFITEVIGYDLSRTCDDIRPYYCHNESCQKSVPESIKAFLEASSFEDAIRNAVSLGGDADTMACIAGSIAEAYYGIPDEMIKECRSRLPNDLIQIVDNFYRNHLRFSVNISGNAKQT